jgi:thiol-disulfide isomerase/thioredoxin
MMKYLVIILIILGSSCKDGKKEVASINADTVLTTDTNVSSENLSNQDLIKIVDYEGLAPLLAKRNDTTYVVNFWATWCRPCVKELPYFEKLNAEYTDKKVKVVLVSLDFPEKLENQVIPYVEKNLKSDVWLLDDADANGWIPKIDKSWSGAIPATLIFNKNHRMFYEHSFTYTELVKEVMAIL